MHKAPVPRVGGIAVYLTFMMGLAAALWLRQVPSPDAVRLVEIAGAATIVFLLGLYDDLRPLSPVVKFSVQSICAFLLYVAGVRVTHVDLYDRATGFGPIVSLGITVFWVLLITNAFNLIDGLDGLSAGSAFCSTLAILAVSVFHGTSTVSLAAVLLAGSILGFLRFNSSPASIFLGDCGSLFIGFMLSAMALAWSEKSSTVLAVSIPVLAFGVPILDVFMAVARRFLRGVPLFRADAEHIHHKLVSRGLSQQTAVFVLYGLSVGFGALSILLTQLRIATLYIVIGILLAAAAVLAWLLRYPEFVEIKRTLHRVAGQKRIIQNNLRIRRAIDLLNHCNTRDEISEVLRSCFFGIGFDELRFDLPGESWTERIAERIDHEIGAQSEPAWQIRMRLTSGTGQFVGAVSLSKEADTQPYLIDGNLLAESGFTTAIADAFARRLPTNATPKRQERNPVPSNSSSWAPGDEVA